MFDHYKATNHTNKRLREELQQSNQRERTFLKLLKRTDQFGAQAESLEKEYEKLFNEEGQSKDPELGGAAAVVQVGAHCIPKLDLSIIYI